MFLLLVSLKTSHHIFNSDLALEAYHKHFCTDTRSSHDLSLAQEMVMWAAATATMHIGIFHLVWKMGRAIYFIAVTDAIPKSSFCQNQLYSTRVTNISGETFDCQSAAILLLFQPLKGSKLT